MAERTINQLKGTMEQLEYLPAELPSFLCPVCKQSFDQDGIALHVKREHTSYYLTNYVVMPKMSQESVSTGGEAAAFASTPLSAAGGSAEAGAFAAPGAGAFSAPEAAAAPQAFLAARSVGVSDGVDNPVAFGNTDEDLDVPEAIEAPEVFSSPVEVPEVFDAPEALEAPAAEVEDLELDGFEDGCCGFEENCNAILNCDCLGGLCDFDSCLSCDFGNCCGCGDCLDCGDCSGCADCSGCGDCFSCKDCVDCTDCCSSICSIM